MVNDNFVIDRDEVCRGVCERQLSRGNERVHTFVLEVSLIKALRTLLIGMSEVWSTARRTRSELGGFDGRKHVQRKVKRSPGAASATRYRNSRNYSTSPKVERHKSQAIDTETGTGMMLTMFSRVGWWWAGSAGSSLSTTTSSARYP